MADWLIQISVVHPKHWKHIRPLKDEHNFPVVSIYKSYVILNHLFIRPLRLLLIKMVPSQCCFGKVEHIYIFICTGH